MKALAKFVFLILSFPFVGIYFLIPKRFSKSFFTSMSQLLSLFPGKTGSYLRLSVYSSIMNNCSFTGVIGFGSIFSDVNTDIAENVYIGPQCNIGKSVIGRNSLIASGVHILSGKNQHDFTDLNTPIQQQGGSYQRITIGEDCWIGNTAVIMANVGMKSIVAAGSVVVNDVPDFAVVAGNPAKVIRSRQ